MVELVSYRDPTESASVLHNIKVGVLDGSKINKFVHLPFFNYQVIKRCSCSTELSTKFIMLINVKMPTIVVILTFISMLNTTSERLKAIDFFICRYFSFYEQLKFHTQLSITSGSGYFTPYSKYLKASEGEFLLFISAHVGSRLFVKIAYQNFFFLFLNQNICCWYS